MRPSRWAVAGWCARKAGRYAAVAVRYAAEAGAHLAGLPAGITDDMGDGATLAAWSCALDFEPAPTRRQVGWECPHASVTYMRAGPVPVVPRMWCGCPMRPVFAGAGNEAL